MRLLEIYVISSPCGCRGPCHQRVRKNTTSRWEKIRPLGVWSAAPTTVYVGQNFLQQFWTVCMKFYVVRGNNYANFTLYSLWNSIEFCIQYTIQWYWRFKYHERHVLRTNGYLVLQDNGSHCHSFLVVQTCSQVVHWNFIYPKKTILKYFSS
jgi:hypothetical protein